MMMAGLGKYVLALGMIVAGASSSCAQEYAVTRDVRDLKATILDLKGLPSDLNNAVSDLSAKADQLAARHGDLAVRQEGKAIRVSMAGDVLFDFDKATIQPAAEKTLSDIGQLIASIPTGAIIVEGHTDAKGSVRYNKSLSLRRANAVAKWLVAHGADKARLSVAALGDTRPIAPNTLADGTDNPDGRALNRRVEFVLPKQ